MNNIKIRVKINVKPYENLNHTDHVKGVLKTSNEYGVHNNLKKYKIKI